MCYFPFIYKGQTFYDKTTLDHRRPWCATVPNFDEMEAWGNVGGK